MIPLRCRGFGLNDVLCHVGRNRSLGVFRSVSPAVMFERMNGTQQTLQKCATSRVTYFLVCQSWFGRNIFSSMSVVVRGRVTQLCCV